MMPFVTGCQRLSKPIEGKTSRYTFTASFVGGKAEQKTTCYTKKDAKTFSRLLKKEKPNALLITKSLNVFDLLRQQITACRSKQDPQAF